MVNSIETGAREEVFRAVRICAPCLDRLGELTFSGATAEMETWREAILTRHLFPAVLKAFEAAREGGARELGAVDAALEAGLAGPPARRSREAGRMLLLELKAPAGERVLERYARAVAGSTVACHFATVFAARAAAFHISPATTMAALIFMEMRSLPVAGVWPAVNAALSGLPASPALLRAA